MKKQSKAAAAAIRAQVEAEAAALAVQLPTAGQSLDDVLQAGALELQQVEAEADKLGTCSQVDTEAEAAAQAKAEAMGATLAAGALDTQAAKDAFKASGESLASVCKALLTLPAAEVRAGLEAGFAQIKTSLYQTEAVTEATPQEKIDKVNKAVRAAGQVLYATCRRINQPKPTDKPLYGLFYVSLKVGCAAIVRVISCPTEAEVREALSHDVKALNGWMAANAEKPAATLASLSGGAADDSQRASGQPDKHAPGNALQAVFDLVAGWRPLELEAAAASFLAMASAQRAAVANAADKPAAEAEAAQLASVASAKHAEAEAEAAQLAEAAKLAVAQAERDKASAKHAAKLQAMRDALAEAEAEAERDAKLAEAMANGQPTEAPTIAQASVIDGQLVVHG